MSRKIFCLLTLILIVFASSGFASGDITKDNKKTDLYKSILKKDKMIIGISFDSKPFGFKGSNGQLQGMEVDLAREIARRLLGNQNKIAFKNVTSQDRIKAVTSGDVDMVISTLTITNQRKKVIDFSVPYFVAGQAICVKKDSKIDTIDDLINKRVIVIIGTTGEKNIKRLAPNALIQGYIHNSDAINAFKSGSDDAITTDDSLLQGLVMDNGSYILLPKRFTKEPYGIAFRKSRQTNELRKNVNLVINEISLDGTLQSIKDKWGLS